MEMVASTSQRRVGDKITFLCSNKQKKGGVMIVGAHGTFENPDISSFYILLKEENMLYKHVNNDMINLE